MRAKLGAFVTLFCIFLAAEGRALAITGGGLRGCAHDFVNGVTATSNANSNSTSSATSNTMAVGSCTFCHTPHGGVSTNLGWNHTLSGQTYQWDVPSTSAGTLFPVFADTAWKGPTAHCLSCHDGTVAIGAVNWFDAGHGRPGSHGPFVINKQTTSLQGLSNTGTTSTLSGVHPVAMPYPWGGLPSTYNGTTTGANFNPGDWKTPPLGKIRIYTVNGTDSVVLGYNGIGPQSTTPNLNGNAGIECSSCHDPHNKNVVDNYFLVGQISGSGASYLCTQCHSK